MALETGNYLNDLNETYPTATDTVSEGDGHLQLIKKVLKQSFPGVDRVSEYIYVHTSAPTVDVGKGRLWLDTSTTPNLLKICNAAGPPATFIKLPISATIDYKLMGNDTVGWVLPTADGTANYPLTTTGSNVLAFAQIATAAIADDAVTTAKIVNNAVDGTKIAMGSDAAGDVLYYNGTDYIRLPKGSAGQILQVNSGATAPEWVTRLATGSAFRVHKNGTDQSISGSSAVKLTWSTKLFDKGTEFSLANERFVATNAGTYFFHASLREKTASGDDDDIYIYKNGSVYSAYSTYMSTGGSFLDSIPSLAVSCLMELGAAEYAEVFYRTETTNVDIEGGASNTWFEGYRIA